MLFFASCQTEEVSKELLQDQTNELDLKAYEWSGKLEENPKERMRNAILELTNFSKKAFLQTNIASEVGAIVKSGFYIDNVVSINDLLNYKSSLAYKYTDVPENFKGSFKEFYDEEVLTNKKLYPNLLNVIENNFSALLKSDNSSLNNNDFFTQADLTYYLPYDKDESNINFNTNSIPTLVPAVIEGDSGLGEFFENTSWQTTTIDDDYGANNYTLIIGPNYDPCSGLSFSPVASIASQESIPADCFETSTGGNDSNPPHTPANIYTGNCNDLKPGASYIRQVYIGSTRLVKQYDRLISLTGNGGGSEIRYCRADSKRAIDIDSLGNYTVNQWDNRVSQYWKRQQIKNQDVRHTMALWDVNWECAGTYEQLFVIYEEDSEGDLFIDQDISFEVDDASYGAVIDIKIQNRSKDEAIIIRTRERVEFFATNLLDQGCGCWHGGGSFANRCWGIYDCGADISYTMPHRWVPVGDNSSY